MHELKGLPAELEQIARELRGEIPPANDAPAAQKKNPMLGRLNQAGLLIRNAQENRR